MLFALAFTIQRCEQMEKGSQKKFEKDTVIESEKPEYFCSDRKWKKHSDIPTL